MNRRHLTPDEALKEMALEWLKRSPAAACCLPLTEAGRNMPPVFLVVGTEAQIHKVGPDDLTGALTRAWEALDKALNSPGVVYDETVRRALAQAWQDARFQLDKLK